MKKTFGSLGSRCGIHISTPSSASVGSRRRSSAAATAPSSPSAAVQVTLTTKAMQCSPPSAVSALDVRRATVGAQHEVAFTVGDVVEGYGREGLHERDAPLGVELVLETSIDHHRVARLQRSSLVLNRDGHLALEDVHDLLRLLVAVSAHFLA